mmetsp:Transcript_10925/g.19801  ORF Transcript_10925/g.19801 Transcript_10925/m.19801 type:complete len:113 (+) Transcript_10925:1405-1743(+)
MVVSCRVTTAFFAVGGDEVTPVAASSEQPFLCSAVDSKVQSKSRASDKEADLPPDAREPSNSVALFGALSLDTVIFLFGYASAGCWEVASFDHCVAAACAQLPALARCQFYC